MPHVYNMRINTKMMIVQLATRLFTEEGYSKVSLSRIAKMLGLSTGNVSFYFPTKDHLLAELVNELIGFQDIMMEQAAREGKSSLLAYCLELTAIASACEESEVARDFYAASYTSALSLANIRESDTRKTKEVFASFRPDWTETDWIATENIVSGIEYATIMTKEEQTPLALQIEKTLDTILYLYGVPRELRRSEIERVLAMDYRALGRNILRDFKEYIERINGEKVKIPGRKNGKALKLQEKTKD